MNKRTCQNITLKLKKLKEAFGYYKNLGQDIEVNLDKCVETKKIIIDSIAEIKDISIIKWSEYEKIKEQDLIVQETRPKTTFFSSKGDRVIFYGQDSILFYDIQSGALVKKIHINKPAEITACCEISEDVFVFGFNNGFFETIDTKTNKKQKFPKALSIEAFTAINGQVIGICPYRDWLITFHKAQNRELKVWDKKSRKLLFTLKSEIWDPDEDCPIFHLELPDNKVAFGGGEKFEIWDMEKKELIKNPRYVADICNLQLVGREIKIFFRGSKIEHSINIDSLTETTEDKDYIKDNSLVINTSDGSIVSFNFVTLKMHLYNTNNGQDKEFGFNRPLVAMSETKDHKILTIDNLGRIRTFGLPEDKDE